LASGFSETTTATATTLPILAQQQQQQQQQQKANQALNPLMHHRDMCALSPVSCSYSVVSNAMCNVCNGEVQPGAGPGQLKLTQEEYNSLVYAHLTELWGNFGPLAEVW
jgi:hypothetical protein